MSPIDGDQARCKTKMAERGRFELPEPVKVQRFSRPPQSTTLPPLRISIITRTHVRQLSIIVLCVRRVVTLYGCAKEWVKSLNPWPDHHLASRKRKKDQYITKSM